MTAIENHSTIILVPGYWLGSWAWDEVVHSLRAGGFQAVPLTLPGLDPQDPQRSSRTLDDQAAAIEDALRRAADATHRPGILVGHSGASAPVSIVVDRHPELVRHLVWVDSGPATPGNAFASDAPKDLSELPLPDFEVLAEHASLEGLTPKQLSRFRARAVPEPGPVVTQAVSLANPERLTVPTTLVCCSLSSSQIMEMADVGHPMFAEVAKLTRRDLVDLPTGHWPMWSRPSELARVIATIARSASA